MATLPRNALEMLGQSPSLSGQREQQVINRAVVAAPTADAAEVVAAQGGARALQVASNTQEYQAEQQAFGTAADLASNARAQACCQKGTHERRRETRTHWLSASDVQTGRADVLHIGTLRPGEYNLYAMASIVLLLL